MTDTPQERSIAKEQLTQQTQVAPQTEQVMAERLLLGALPRPQVSSEKGKEYSLDKDWPEHLQQGLDLAIVTTLMSGGIIAAFLWMAGLF